MFKSSSWTPVPLRLWHHCLNVTERLGEGLCSFAGLLLQDPESKKQPSVQFH